MPVLEQGKYKVNLEYRGPESKGLIKDLMGSCLKDITGCEGDLAVTSVTPLIARVDSADLAG